MVTILMMPAKRATLVFLKIKMFKNKDYDFMISNHDDTNKILSRDSCFKVDVVM